MAAPQCLGLGAGEHPLLPISGNSLCTLVLLRLICRSKLSWLSGGVCLKCNRHFSQEYNALPMPPNGLKWFETTRAYHLHAFFQWLFSLFEKCHISISVRLASASVRRVSVCLSSQHFGGVRRDHKLLDLKNLTSRMMGRGFHMLLLWLNTGRSWRA